MSDPTHLIFLFAGLSIGLGVLFLFWWFVSRLEQRIGILVQRELAALVAQISAFREDVVGEARLAISTARTSHMLLVKVEERVEGIDRRLRATEEKLAALSKLGA